MKAKLFDVNNLLWLALVLALAGSLKHLAAIFASIDGNTFMGWLQAVAVDTGLFALAYSIRVRKVARRSIKPLWFGVTLFTGISIYGNLAYGLLATGGNLPAWIVASRPYVLAGSLPILVLFLSELLSDDRQHANEKEEKKRQFAQFATKHTDKSTSDWLILRQLIWDRDGKRCVDCNADLSEAPYDCHHIIPEFQGGEGKPDNLVTLCRSCHKKRHKGDTFVTKGLDSLDKANEARITTEEQRKRQLATLHEENPLATITELATQLGVSRGTVRNYASELDIELATNGNGRG